MFKLPELPFEKDALEPYISKETIEYHYGKHHQTYVDKLNGLVKGTDYENMSLEDVINNSNAGIFNNSAQIWNHTFYWNCLSPQGGGEPKGELMTKIKDKFGSYENFKKEFSDAAIANFGSGWTWLVLNNQNSVEIISTSNAETILTTQNKALMVIDVWEHAYYIDYRNSRPNYIDAFWKLVNWDFIENNL